MAKYVPYLSSVAPDVPLLSPGYCATEGVVGLAASLLQAVAPLPPAASAAGEEAASDAHLAAAQQQQRQQEGGACETYVLLPHLSAFYEFLPEGGGTPCT